MDQRIKGIALIAGILAVTVALAFIADSSGISSLFSTYPVSTNSGVKLLGMSAVSIATNPIGPGSHVFSGSWWIATAIVGGLENINVQTSASSFSPNASYVCATTCQQNNLQISGTFNKIYYPVSSDGTPLDSYYITYLGNGQPKTLSFDSCYGGIYPVPTQVESNSPQNFNGCAVGYGSATISYANACTNAGGVPLDINSAFDVGCYQLNARPVGYVYSVGTGQVRQGVRVTFNGQSETVSTNNTFNDSLSNMALYYIQYVPGTLNGPIPSPSDSSGATVVVITNQSLASAIGRQNNTALLEGTVLQSQVSSLIYNIQQKFPQESSLSQASTDISDFQASEFGLFINNSVNGEFKYAQFSGTQSPSLLNNFRSDVPTYLVINDSNYQYAAPEVQLLIQAQSLGLYLGFSTFALQSETLSNFKSGSTSTLSVTVVNNGSATGGFTLGVTPNQQTVSVSPPQVSGSLNQGQEATYQFTIGDNEQSIPANSNVSRSVTVNLCSLSGQCIKKTVDFNVQNPCPNNQPFNAGTCAGLTTIPAPTTTIPGENTSTSTTTVPCNPNLGTCGPPPPQGLTWWQWLIIIAVIASFIAIVAMFAYGYLKR